MPETQETDDVWQHLFREVQASHNAASLQLRWQHWDMARQYARLLMDRLGIDARAEPRKNRRR